ncbi:MAG: hypothetical protein IT269_06190, partial [Saprospiraceae bacterium]|nr:hypothetical protein [Saprospiraceae bacterium]
GMMRVDYRATPLNGDVLFFYEDYRATPFSFIQHCNFDGFLGHYDNPL